MAARRLVLILLLLLVVSTFAATLVPPPEGSDETSSTTTTGAAATEPRGRLVHKTISADARDPERIRLTVGDQLTLRVTSKRFREVEIPTLGEFDEVDRFAPAIFDLQPDERGTYPVRVLGARRPIARIVVNGCCRRAGRSAGTSRSR